MPPELIAGLIREARDVELLATKAIALLCIVVFAFEVAIARGEMMLMSAPTSTLVRFGALTGELAAVEPWRVVASCFVHIGYAHVVFNVLALADFGRAVEESQGAARTFVGGVGSGVVGFAASIAWYADAPYVTAGASGIAFGLIGMFVGELASRGDYGWKGVLLRHLGYSFMWFFLFSTNQAAHLAGLASGFACGWVFHRLRRSERRELMFGALAGALALACVASVALSMASDAWRPIRALEVQMRDAWIE